MKIKLTAIALLLIATIGNISSVEAQVPVITEMIPFPDGPDRQAYVVTIPMVELKKTNRCWGEYLEENAFGWESVRKGIHRQSGIMEKTISDRRFSVGNEIVMTDKGVRLTIWFEQNRKAFVAQESGDQLDVAMKKYIHDFAIGEYRRGIQSQLKDEQRAKQKMELKLALLARNQDNTRHALSENDYRIQTEAVNRTIDAQDLKMTGLLDKLDTIR